MSQRRVRVVLDLVVESDGWSGREWPAGFAVQQRLLNHRLRAYVLGLVSQSDAVLAGRIREVEAGFERVRIHAPKNDEKTTR